MKEKNSKRTRARERKSAIERERERKGGSKKNEEMGNKWEGDGTLTIGSTLNFIQIFIQNLDEMIFDQIMNIKTS